MRIAVIIVNYNVKYFVEQCIHSIQRASKGLKVDVYVVDNCSSDYSINYLRPRFPDVTFIVNDDNEGFSKANNKAILASKSDYVALVNPDTLVNEKIFQDCLRAMQADKKIGAIGAKMHGADGQFAYESRRGFPSPMTSFYKISGLAKLFPYSKRIGRYNLRFLDKNESNVIDIISGAFMFIRRKALDRVGLLDEQFFMYGEDIDLSYRITKAGYKNFYLPTTLIHYKGESTKTESVKYVKIFYEAMVIFFRKHFSHTGFLFSCLIKMTIALRACLALIPRTIRKVIALFNLSKKKNVFCFIVLGSEKTIHQVRELCEHNGLNAAHRFIIANERTNNQGHLLIKKELAAYTHVVYDLETYSLNRVIELLSSKESQNIKLGTYSTITHKLILPEVTLK